MHSGALVILWAALVSVQGQITSCEFEQGLQTYPDPSSCDAYYKCANGTLTQETCENGLLFSGKSAVHDNCDYHWNVDCQDRPSDLSAGREGACPYSFGIFPSGDGCADYFVKCAFGQAEPQLCTEGLAYDERSHACNWPDLLPECSIGDAEQIVGYSCPDRIPAGSASLQFGPFPRFATGRCDRLVTCVDYYPRLTRCGQGQSVDENSLTCVDSEFVPGC